MSYILGWSIKRIWIRGQWIEFPTGSVSCLHSLGMRYHAGKWLSGKTHRKLICIEHSSETTEDALLAYMCIIVLAPQQPKTDIYRQNHFVKIMEIVTSSIDNIS